MIIKCVVKLCLFHFSPEFFFQGLTYLVLEGILVCLLANTFLIPITN